MKTYYVELMVDGNLSGRLCGYVEADTEDEAEQAAYLEYHSLTRDVDVLFDGREDTEYTEDE